MKKFLLVLTITVACAASTFAQKVRMDVIIGKIPPSASEMNLLKVEEDKHSNIAKAMHDIHDAIDALNKAPDEFGGHKAQAAADLNASYISLRKALYYRLYEDKH
jgi:hypothetical protein